MNLFGEVSTSPRGHALQDCIQQSYWLLIPTIKFWVKWFVWTLRQALSYLLYFLWVNCIDTCKENDSCVWIGSTAGCTHGTTGCVRLGQLMISDDITEVLLPAVLRLLLSLRWWGCRGNLTNKPQALYSLVFRWSWFMHCEIKKFGFPRMVRYLIAQQTNIAASREWGWVVGTVSTWLGTCHGYFCV